MTIKAIQTDYDGLSELLRECGENPTILPKRIDRFNDALAVSQRHYVLLDQNKIIAMGAAWLRPDDIGKPMLHLKHVSVDLKYRGQGHARTLLNMAFKDAHENGAYVWNEGFSSESNRIKLGGSMKKIAAQYPNMDCILN